jgi:hypothetical protein
MAMNEQYGNSGYNRVGDNPFDDRGGEANRYNNYSNGTYGNSGRRSAQELYLAHV